MQKYILPPTSQHEKQHTKEEINTRLKNSTLKAINNYENKVAARFPGESRNLIKKIGEVSCSPVLI